MTYHYLDKWDIKRLEEHMNDRQSLLLVIDDIVSSYAQCNYEQGYEFGYENGYDQALLDGECE